MPSAARPFYMLYSTHFAYMETEASEVKPEILS